MESLRSRWRRFVALGAGTPGMGIAALIFVTSATIASVYTVAIFMILTGGAEIATGLGAKTRGRFFLWIAAGLAYVSLDLSLLRSPRWRRRFLLCCSAQQ